MVKLMEPLQQPLQARVAVATEVPQPALVGEEGGQAARKAPMTARYWKKRSTPVEGQMVTKEE